MQGVSPMYLPAKLEKLDISEAALFMFAVHIRSGKCRTSWAAYQGLQACILLNRMLDKGSVLRTVSRSNVAVRLPKDDAARDVAHVEAGGQLLKALLAWVVGFLVQLPILFQYWQLCCLPRHAHCCVNPGIFQLN